MMIPLPKIRRASVGVIFLTGMVEPHDEIKSHHKSGSFNVANHGPVHLPDQPHPAFAATTLPELAGWRGPKSCLMMLRKRYVLFNDL
jgi:hypothetical protein